MNKQNYNFTECDFSNWLISLVRNCSNSKLTIHAPEDMGMILNLVSLDPHSEATAQAFEAISKWVENNFPQWDIVNIVPEHKV